MKVTTDEIIKAIESQTLVWCWHNSALHCGKDRSAVLIVKRRSDGWVLVKFDDETRLWARESELELVNQKEETK